MLIDWQLGNLFNVAGQVLLTAFIDDGVDELSD